jgi:hypothetical protein
MSVTPSMPTWHGWRKIPVLRSGGPFASHAKNRLNRVNRVNGGPTWKSSSITIRVFCVSLLLQERSISRNGRNGRNEERKETVLPNPKLTIATSSPCEMPLLTLVKRLVLTTLHPSLGVESSCEPPSLAWQPLREISPLAMKYSKRFGASEQIEIALETRINTEVGR